MEKEKNLDSKEQQVIPEGTERTRDCRCFIPRTDIYEADDKIYIVLDVPGIHENAIEITLEKNVLTVKGMSQVEEYDNYSQAYSEYEPGDFERSFKISDMIDREKIEAVSKDGVLRLTLPRAEQAKLKKITVKAG